MSRRAILVLAAVLTASSGCYGVLYPGERKRLNQCGEILARLERAAQTLPATVPGLGLHAAKLRSGKYHPHGGIDVCYYAGLAPNGWTHSEEPFGADGSGDSTQIWTSPASDRGGASLRYTLTGGRGPERLADYIERVELAPVRLRGDLHRASRGRTTNSREHRHLIVNREHGAVHLRMLRWRAEVEDNWYLRCEAVLTGEYEASVTLFEAICDALSVRHWDYSW
nr:hypothetical protein [Nannocystis sp.]